MTRYEANNKILEILQSYAQAYPDQRFGQMLVNLSIANYRDTYDTNYNPTKVDIFFEESTNTLERISKELPGYESIDELPTTDTWN